MRDRPVKFTGEQAGFKRGATNENRCGTCRHWYFGEVAQRKVCEVVRLDPEENIEREDTCDFWNENGKDFPKLKK